MITTYEPSLVIFDVSALGREIDELGYALRGLAAEEIQIVDGAAK